MDLVVSALFKGSRKPARVLFLMEHKSQEDPDLLRQFLVYQAGIYQDTRDPVLPVFINQSPNKTWKGPLDFHSFLNNFKGELKKRFKENVLNFCPRVLNIQALDIDKAKGLTTRPILYILKHIWNLNATKIKELWTIGRGLSPKEREALIVRAVDYVRQYDPGQCLLNNRFYPEGATHENLVCRQGEWISDSDSCVKWCLDKGEKFAQYHRLCDK